MAGKTEYENERDYAKKVLGVELADSCDKLTSSIASDLDRLSFSMGDDREKYKSYQSLNSLPDTTGDRRRSRPDSMPVFGAEILQADTRPASATTNTKNRTLVRQTARHNAQLSSSSSEEEEERPKRKPKKLNKSLKRLVSQIKQFGSRDEKKDSE